jgi:hypothetical protein
MAAYVNGKNCIIANNLVYGGALGYENVGDDNAFFNNVADGCTDDWTDTNGDRCSVTFNVGEGGDFPDQDGNITSGTIVLVDETPDTVTDYTLDPTSDGYNLGRNGWTVSPRIRRNRAGTLRSRDGAWNMGAY